MLTPDLNLLLHGDHAALPEQKPLSAGPLTLIFEAGDLRHITLGRRFGPIGLGCASVA